MRAKYHIYLTAEERRVVINSLIDLRNNLISQGMYTDLVDELLIGDYIYTSRRLFAAELNTARAG